MKGFKKPASVFLAMVLLFALMPLNIAQAGGYAVSGKLVDGAGTGANLSGVTVYLKDTSYNSIYTSTQTDALGNFTLYALDGAYTVYVEPYPGYYDKSETSTVTVSGTDVTGVNLLLIPDQTPPDISSIWAATDTGSTCLTNNTLTKDVNFDLTQLTLHANEGITVDDTKTITIEGGAYTAGTPYGGAALDPGDSDNKTVIITPLMGNEKFSQADTYTITLEDGLLLDRQSNGSGTIEITVNATGDSTLPVIESITATVNDAEHLQNAGGAFDFTIDFDHLTEVEVVFSEVGTVDESKEITIDGGAYTPGASFGDAAPGSDSKTLIITPESSNETFSQSGTYEITIPQNTFSDLAGNGNDEAKITINAQEDTDFPVIESITVTVNGSQQQPDANDTFNFTLELDKVTEVRIVYDEDVTVDNTKEATFGGGSGAVADGTTYGDLTVDLNDESKMTVLLTPETANQTFKQAGRYEVKMPSGAVKDASGNESAEETLKFDVHNIQLPYIQPTPRPENSVSNECVLYSSWDNGNVEIKGASWSNTATSNQVTVNKDKLKESLYSGCYYDYYADFYVGTDFAGITFDSDATKNLCENEKDGDIVFKVEQVDVDSFDDDVKEKIGDRPVLDFSLKIGDEQITDLAGKASIGIHYTPKEGEDPNAVVVYYVDSSGQLQETRGTYNEVAREVVFTVNHFSVYGVSYNEIRYSDVEEDSAHYDAVTFIAARGVLDDIAEDGLFEPEKALTRGEYMAMILRAYCVPIPEDSEDNFDDAGDGWYAGYLAAAKSLGISNGVGGNLYLPDAHITVQDAVTMLCRLLNVIGELPQIPEDAELEGSVDYGSAADYAVDSVETLIYAGILDADTLNLSTYMKRYEAALILYMLLSAV